MTKNEFYLFCYFRKTRLSQSSPLFSPIFPSSIDHPLSYPLKSTECRCVDREKAYVRTKKRTVRTCSAIKLPEIRGTSTEKLNSRRDGEADQIFLLLPFFSSHFCNYLCSSSAVLSYSSFSYHILSSLLVSSLLSSPFFRLPATFNQPFTRPFCNLHLFPFPFPFSFSDFSLTSSPLPSLCLFFLNCSILSYLYTSLLSSSLLSTPPLSSPLLSSLSSSLLYQSPYF
jgi:hypothetical protein